MGNSKFSSAHINTIRKSSMKGQIFEEMLTKNLSNYNHIQAQGKQLKTKEKENFKSSKRKK